MKRDAVVRTLVSAAAGTFLALTVLVAPAAAQQLEGLATGGVNRNWGLWGRGGLNLPVGDVASTHRYAETLSAGVRYWVGPRLSLGGSVGRQFYRGERIEAQVLLGNAPDVELTHYGLEAAYEFTSPGTTGFHVVGYGRGGLTSFTLEEETIGFTTGGLATISKASATYPHASGGVRIAYRATPRLDFTLGGGVTFVFADESDTAVLETYTRSDGTTGSTGLDAFGLAWSVPFHVGVRWYPF